MVQPGTNILLIGDDPAVRDNVAVALAEAGAGVKTVSDGASAVLLASSGWRPAVVVVDLLLSTRDAYVTCRALRTAFGAPIIVVAPPSSRLRDEVDEVVPRPVDVRQLLQRIEERCGVQVPTVEVIRAGDLLLMPRSGKAFLAGEALPLSPDELSLLACLAQHAGQEVRKGVLRGALRGVTGEVDPRIVDIHLIRVMVKLESSPSTRLRRTPANDAYVLAVDGAPALTMSA